MVNIWKNYAGQITAGCLVVGLYVVAIPVQITDAQHTLLTRTGPDKAAARFAFLETPLLPLDNGQVFKQDNVRVVHPRFKTIAKWISAVGASVTLGDLDGDGFSNDVCLVDPRNDSISIKPAPGTPARYEPFFLPVPSEGYDPATIAPMGCLIGDLDEDGRSDLVIYFWGRTPVAYLAISDTPGPNGYKLVEIVPTRAKWFTNAATFADVNGDGHPDLIISNYFPDGSGVLDIKGRDNVEMQHSMSRAYNGGRSRLFLWESAGVGNIRYREILDAFPDGVATGWTLAVGAVDLDGDLRPEIYFANDFGPDRLFHNRTTKLDHPKFELVEGRRSFFDPRSRVLGKDSFKGMGVDFGDVNNDGFFDIYVSNIAQEFALQESHFLFVHSGDLSSFARGEAPFRDQSGKLGLARSYFCWDAKLADFDNDGRLEALQACGFIKGEVDRWPQLHELATGNDELLKFPEFWPAFAGDADLSGRGHDHFFVADSLGHYHDISAFVGIGRETISRGIAIADVNQDGKLDFAIARQWQDSSFYLNISKGHNSALGLNLRLPGGVPGTSRPAIGAIASVTLSNGRKLVSYVDGGNGHSGKRAPEIHFGLGEADASIRLKVDVAWRDKDGCHNITKYLPPGYHTIPLIPSQGVSKEVIHRCRN